MEVIEHVDPPRLPALEAAVFGHARPGDGRRDHAERRVQRALRGPRAGHAAPPRPPLRVGPRASSRPGPTAVAARYGYTVTLARRRRRGPGRRRAHPDGGVHAEVSARSIDLPELVPRRAGRRLRLGQVHLRPRGTSRRTAGALLRLLPRRWSPTTRTTSPRRPTPSTRCTTSPASGCAAGRLTVVDATNVQPHARAGAGRAGPGARRAAGRDRARRAARRCAWERTAGRARPRLRPRRSSPGSTATCAARCGSSAGRASARCTCCADVAEIDAARSSRTRSCSTTSAT